MKHCASLNYRDMHIFNKMSGIASNKTLTLARPAAVTRASHYLFLYGATAPGGSGPPLSRCF